jgi:type II restriction enzyme
MYTIEEAKNRLDMIIRKARVDMYKPIQIAEVLRYSRLNNNLDILNIETYRNQSRQWRNTVTQKLLNKGSTSSSRYQDDIWNQTAMPPEILSVLDQENKRTQGVVEHYIYLSFGERQATVSSVITYIKETEIFNFNLRDLLQLFVSQPGIRRSIDKAYEIVVYSLFETIVVALDAEINISIPPSKQEILMV